MDKELKQELSWIVENLATIAKNQTLIYAELQKIEQQAKIEEKAG